MWSLAHFAAALRRLHTDLFAATVVPPAGGFTTGFSPATLVVAARVFTRTGLLTVVLWLAKVTLVLLTGPIAATDPANRATLMHCRDSSVSTLHGEERAAPSNRCKRRDA